MNPTRRARVVRSVAAVSALTTTTLGLSAGLAASSASALDGPLALATAMVVDPTVVTTAALESTPPLGTTAAVGSTPLLGFPTAGDDYTILSSGDVANVFPGASADEDLDGESVRGDTDFDVTEFRVDVTVPPTANCLASLDFRFLSQEYPQYVGTEYNDAFIFEIDDSTWTTSGSEIEVANNLAFDELGNLISINAAGSATMSEDLAFGSGLNGSTRTLTASAPISPGVHSLHFSVFDQGDQILDSAVLLDNLSFGHVDDPADCQPGVVPNHGDPVTATEPVFTDGDEPHVTIPDTAGLIYYIDDAAVEPGINYLEPGTVVTVRARTASGDDYLDGPSSWTHYVPGGMDLTPVTPAAPVFTDEPGTEGDTVTIPATEGVDYYLDWEPVEAGTHPVPWGYAEVVAEPATGYAIQGPSSWQWTFETDGPAPAASRTSAQAVAAAVVATEPTADLEAGTYTVPSSPGVEYYVDGMPAQAGTHPGAGTIVVSALPTGEDPINGATQWSFTFPAASLDAVTATAPVFTDLETGGGTVHIPTVPGVDYTIDDEPAGAGTHQATGSVVVRALPEEGFVVEGVTAWSKTFLTSAIQQVTAPAPTFQDESGTEADSYTIPSKVGVRYLIGGDVVTAGTYAVDPASADVVVDAVATAGYELVGQSSWSETFTSLQQMEPGTPTITGAAVVGRTLQAAAGTWLPADVALGYQWLRDDAPIEGADEASYVLTAADRGYEVAVEVTGTKEGYEDATAVSEPTVTVLGALSTVKPKVKGEPVVGKTLTAVPGTWQPTGVTFTYRWFRGDKAIAKATGKKYKATLADKGSKLSVKVTGTKEGYAPASLRSAQTSKVTKG